MIKPNLSNIPGMDAMTGTLDFVKNLWGGMSVPGMGIPGMVMPTLSVDEINKQISDLKAVESWLTLNMNMLRGTIQALEVQSATISTLQSMGETLSAAVKSKPRSSFESMPEAAPKPAPEPAPPVEKTPPAADAQLAPEANREPNEQAAKFVAPQANPAMWWNMLQDQFKQAVNSAMASEPAKSASKAAPAALKPRKTAKAGKTTPRKRAPAAKKSGSKPASKGEPQD